MANLVLNPSFESISGANNFTDWTEITAGLTVFGNTTNPHTGTRSAQLGLLQPPLPPVAAGTISQTVTGLVPGSKYNLLFWGASYDLVGVTTVTVTSLLSAIWLSVNVNISILTGVNGYTLYSYEFTALDTAAILTFLNIGLSVVLVDDVSITQALICFSGKAMVRTKDVITGEISDTMAENVYSDKHLVYSTRKKEFIPIIYNIVTGPTQKICVIEKNLIGENIPDRNLNITSGHYIEYNGDRIKVGKILGVKKIKLSKPILVYSICVDENQPILVNNMPVYAWGHVEWLERIKKSVISWKNNN